MKTLLIYGGTFGISFLLFRTVFLYEWIITIGVGLIAWTLTGIIAKIIVDSAKRTFVLPEKKVILITGCDTGFGHLLVQRLDKLGFHVFAGCLFPTGQGAGDLKAACSDRLTIVPLDVTKDSDVEDAANKITNNLNDDEGLWAIVNNAGIAAYTEIEWCSLETYRRIYDVNSLGVVRVTKAFLPLLRKNGGRVVIVASLAGRYTFPGFSAYSMSKHATVSFADGLRREMKKWGITVHTVEPSSYKTPITQEKLLQDILQRTWDDSPKGIQESYGEEYFAKFKESLKVATSRAKNNVDEVVDDILHAAIGDQPKMRYVPSTVVQLRAYFISSLPTCLQDMILGQVAPKTLPAEAPTPPPSPLTKIRPQLQRSLSVPVAILRKRLTQSKEMKPDADTPED